MSEKVEGEGVAGTGTTSYAHPSSDRNKRNERNNRNIDISDECFSKTFAALLLFAILDFPIHQHSRLLEHRLSRRLLLVRRISVLAKDPLHDHT